MSRLGFASTDLSIQRFLNQSTIQSPSEPTEDRQVALTNGSPTAVTPSTGCVAMHIQNNTGVNLRYGGASVTAATGVILYPGSTLEFKSAQEGFILYVFCNSAGKNLDIVEFF